VAVAATDFAAVTGFDVHDFLLVATGRKDASDLGLPESVNIFR
jgi:hypothetical protein